MEMGPASAEAAARASRLPRLRYSAPRKETISLGAGLRVGSQGGSPVRCLAPPSSVPKGAAGGQPATLLPRSPARAWRGLWPPSWGGDGVAFRRFGVGGGANLGCRGSGREQRAPGARLSCAEGEGRLALRTAGPADAEAVARLHADSWRRHYVGAYADAFLDGDVLADRIAVWSERLRASAPSRRTFLAEIRGLVGFAHVVLDDDPNWRALLDNMHVAAGYQRCGIGSRLLALSARAVVERTPPTGLYVWVLEQNLDAQAFYRARGGSRAGRELVAAPGGIPGRLVGSPAKLRYAWRDPAVLLR